MLHVVKLGRRSYDWTLATQERLFKTKVAEEQRIRKSYAATLMSKTANTATDGAPTTIKPAPEVSNIPDVVLTVEHTPGVYTVGKRQMPGHFLSAGGVNDNAEGQQLPATHHGQQVVKIRRGGGVTWHGPGQITVYPIVSVKRWWETSPQPLDIKGSSPLRWYTDVLEQAIIDGVTNSASSSSAGLVSDGSGISGGEEMDVDVVRRRLAARLTGVWFDDRKVASIGLQVSDWISMHGYAVNITSDPSWFDKIVMCELPGKHATNLEQVIEDVRGGADRNPPTIEDCEEVVVASLLGRLSGSDIKYNNHRSIAHVSQSLVESGRLSSEVIVHDLKEMNCEEVNTVLDRIASGL